jgi:ATP-dependent exoDNAse (exonuclease V) beta subunit
MSFSTKPLKVYKSSAGSGKTTTLALEYLKLTLGKNDHFRHILALTFTNKAAEEMKDRILEYLHKIIYYAKNSKTSKKPFFYDQLIKTTPKYTSLDENKALAAIGIDSKVLYKQLIHRYSEYAVTTIDSFTNRIIKSFSYDLGLSFNYQVELKAEILLDLAIEELLSRIDAKEQLITEVLIEYSHNQIQNDKSRKIRDNLKKRAKSLLNDLEEEHLVNLRQFSLEKLYELLKTINSSIDDIENDLQKVANAFIQMCFKNGIEPNSFLRGSFYNYFKNIANNRFDKLTPTDSLLKNVTENKWTSKTVSIEQKQLIDNKLTEIIGLFNRIQSFAADYLLLKSMSNRFYPFMVMIELEKLLKQLKSDKEILHISDFNKIISKYVAHETAPYIYERIGTKFQHYLLDEFQDTSVLQWYNLLPLVENGISQNQFSMAVGDAKQAIYRWRGSDVEQFVEFPMSGKSLIDPYMIERQNLLMKSFEEINLKTNYRSGKTIVLFNNRLFEHIIKHNYIPDSLSAVYKNTIQYVDKKKEKAASFAQIRTIEYQGADKRDEIDEKYINHIYQIIQENLKDGYSLKNIAVLARKNDVLLKIARFLIEHNIPVKSSESLNVDTSPLVKFVLSFLKHLLHPNESLYQAEIIYFLSKSEKFKLDFNLHAQFKDKKQNNLSNLWPLLEVNIDTESLINKLPYEAIEEICAIFDLDKNDSLLHFFIEASYSYSAENPESLEGFLEWWKQNGEDYKLDLPDEWNAVSLLSFHKAKGLGFPVVVNLFSDHHFNTKSDQKEIWINPEIPQLDELKSFPFTISSLKNTKFHQIYEREKEFEILDTINLFYVAMTRPKERLYLLVNKVDSTRKSKSKDFQFDNLIHGFLKNEKYTEIHHNIFQFGEKNEVSVSSLSNKKQIQISKSSFYDWRGIVSLSLSDKEQSSSETDWGKKVHHFFALLKSKKDLDRLTTSNLKLQDITKEEFKELKAMGIEVMRHHLLSQHFDQGNQVFCEKEFYDNNAKVFRPDRIVFYPYHIYILDYKTGKHTIKNEEQIHYYMHNLNRLFKKKTIGLLVYLENDLDVRKYINLKNEA